MVVEGELAQRYRVSKTPIREALALLSREGLVEVVPRRGILIAPISITDVQHTFLLRTLLEPEAVAIAATRIGPDQLAELRDLLPPTADGSPVGHGVGAGAPDAARSPQIEAEVANNREFHLAVVEASQVPRLTTIIRGLLEQVERFYHYHPAGRAVHPPHEDRHEALLAALADRDPGAARSIVSESIQHSRQHLLASLIEDPLQPGIGRAVSLDRGAG